MLPSYKPIHLILSCAGGSSSYFRAILEASVGEDNNLEAMLGRGSRKASVCCWCYLVTANSRGLNVGR